MKDNDWQNQPTRDTFLSVLSSLNQSNDIVDSLNRIGAKGIPNSDSDNPVIKWIKDTTERDVLLRHDYINNSIEIKCDDKVYGFFDFTRLNHFLYLFDRENYPQLIDPIFTQQLNSALAL